MADILPTVASICHASFFGTTAAAAAAAAAAVLMCVE
jgi:hypothetical protein